eukprot:c18441_g1_i1.p1 GENE.c18441_g1_i1~~c18441_g1_i1.p1  ORF type:complete len:769 (+),score=174.28 c18441_g1_i1:233-2308(+)
MCDRIKAFCNSTKPTPRSVPFTRAELRQNWGFPNFNCPIHLYAAWRWRASLNHMECFVQAGSDPDAFGAGPLHISGLLETICARGNTWLGEEADRYALVKKLLDMGCDPIARGPAGNHPLFATLTSNYLTIARLFLEHPICIEQYDNEVDLTKVGKTKVSEIDWSQVIKRPDGRLATIRDLPVTFLPRTHILHLACRLGRVDFIAYISNCQKLQSLFCVRNSTELDVFSSCVLQSGNDEAMKRLHDQFLRVFPLFPALLDPTPALVYVGPASLLREKPSTKLRLMVKNTPEALQHMFNTKVWESHQIGNDRILYIDVIPFVVDRAMLAQLEGHECNADSVTAEQLASFDPLATIWGQYITATSRVRQGHTIRNSQMAQKILNLKWDAYCSKVALRYMLKDFLIAALSSAMVTSGNMVLAIITMVGFAYRSFMEMQQLVGVLSLRWSSKIPCVPKRKGQLTQKSPSELLGGDVLFLYITSGWNWFDFSLCVMAPIACLMNMDVIPMKMELQAVFVLINWIRLLQYVSLSPYYALLVRMIFPMVKDMLKFLWVYVFFVIGFGLAFYSILHDKSDRFDTIPKAFVSCYLITLGDFLHEEIALGGIFAEALWVLFTALVTLLLLNMLIAMMATSYEAVGDRALGDLLMARAINVLQIERSIRHKERVKMWEKILATDPEGGAFWSMVVDESGLVK